MKLDFIPQIIGLCGLHVQLFWTSNSLRFKAESGKYFWSQVLADLFCVRAQKKPFHPWNGYSSHLRTHLFTTFEQAVQIRALHRRGIELINLPVKNVTHRSQLPMLNGCHDYGQRFPWMHRAKRNLSYATKFTAAGKCVSMLVSSLTREASHGSKLNWGGYFQRRDKFCLLWDQPPYFCAIQLKEVVLLCASGACCHTSVPFGYFARMLPGAVLATIVMAWISAEVPLILRLNMQQRMGLYLYPTPNRYRTTTSFT